MGADLKELPSCVSLSVRRWPQGQRPRQRPRVRGTHYPSRSSAVRPNLSTFRSPLTHCASVLYSLCGLCRKEVPQAVADCHTAGVKVVMVTGDHPLTAAAIARKIGLITLPTRDVLAKERGVPIDQVDPADVDAVVVSE